MATGHQISQYVTFDRLSIPHVHPPSTVGTSTDRPAWQPCRLVVPSQSSPDMTPLAGRRRSPIGAPADKSGVAKTKIQRQRRGRLLTDGPVCRVNRSRNRFVTSRSPRHRPPSSEGGRLSWGRHGVCVFVLAHRRGRIRSPLILPKPVRPGRWCRRRPTLRRRSRLWLALLAVVWAGARRDPSSRPSCWCCSSPRRTDHLHVRTHTRTYLPRYISPDREGSMGSVPPHWPPRCARVATGAKKIKCSIGKTEERKKEKRGRDIPSQLGREVLASWNGAGARRARHLPKVRLLAGHAGRRDMALCFPLGLGRGEGLAVLGRRLHRMLGGVGPLLLLLLLLLRHGARGRQRLGSHARGRAGHGHVRRPSLLLQGRAGEMWI
jgi:hypothetical protein